jgi:uncharacterized protein (DUF58 family)
VIVFILILLLLVWLWPNIWFLFVQNCLDVNVRVLSRLIEVGETFELECTVTNRGWMPIPNLEMLVSLPDGVIAAGSVEQHILRLRTHLGGRQTVVIRGRLQGARRGVQSFAKHPLQIVLNEGFGLRSLSISREIADEVVVLPVFVDLRKQSVRLEEISGKLEVFRWLHPDESLLRGIRPYQRGDAFKHIAWGPSASMGEWMVKQYASSADANVVLVLNAQFHEQYWYGTNRLLFDELASQAATLAYFLRAQGFALHLASNAIVSDHPLKMFHGRQTAAGIRTLLGEMQPYANSDFATLWAGVSRNLPEQAKVILLTGFLTDAQRQLLQRGAMAGRTILVEAEHESSAVSATMERGVDAS